MSVTVPTHLTNGSAAPGTSVATASVTRANNALGLLTVIAVNLAANGNPVVPTVSDASGSWTQVATVVYSAASAAVLVRLTMFSKLGAANTGVITIAHSAAPTFSEAWEVDQFSVVATVGSVVQAVTNTGTGTSLTVTLGAFASSNNAVYAVFDAPTSGASSFVPGAGFTILNDDGLKTATEYKVTNDTSVDISWTTSSDAGGIAIEVKGPQGRPLVNAGLVEGGLVNAGLVD